MTNTPAQNRFLVLALASMMLFSSNLYAWKKEVHVVSLPLIEGAGIYSSVRILQDSQSGFTKASAITNLSILASNTALGSYIIFGPQTHYALLRSIHQYIGIGLTATALWMSLTAGNDPHIQNSDRKVIDSYTIVTAVPIIVFSF